MKYKKDSDEDDGRIFRDTESSYDKLFAISKTKNPDNYEKYQTVSEVIIRNSFDL